MSVSDSAGAAVDAAVWAGIWLIGIGYLLTHGVAGLGWSFGIPLTFVIVSPRSSAGSLQAGAAATSPAHGSDEPRREWIERDSPLAIFVHELFAKEGSMPHIRDGPTDGTPEHERRSSTGGSRSCPLLEALRHGEATSAERLVTTYGDRAYRLAFRITGNSRPMRKKSGRTPCGRSSHDRRIQG